MGKESLWRLWRQGPYGPRPPRLLLVGSMPPSRNLLAICSRERHLGRMKGTDPITRLNAALSATVLKTPAAEGAAHHEGAIAK